MTLPRGHDVRAERKAVASDRRQMTAASGSFLGDGQALSLDLHGGSIGWFLWLLQKSVALYCMGSIPLCKKEYNLKNILGSEVLKDR